MSNALPLATTTHSAAGRFLHASIGEHMDEFLGESAEGWNFCISQIMHVLSFCGFLKQLLQRILPPAVSGVHLCSQTCL